MNRSTLGLGPLMPSNAETDHAFDLSVIDRFNRKAREDDNVRYTPLDLPPSRWPVNESQPFSHYDLPSNSGTSFQNRTFSDPRVDYRDQSTNAAHSGPDSAYNNSRTLKRRIGTSSGYAANDTQSAHARPDTYQARTGSTAPHSAAGQRHLLPMPTAQGFGESSGRVFERSSALAHHNHPQQALGHDGAAVCNRQQTLLSHGWVSGAEVSGNESDTHRFHSGFNTGSDGGRVSPGPLQRRPPSRPYRSPYVCVGQNHRQEGNKAVGQRSQVYNEDMDTTKETDFTNNPYGGSIARDARVPGRADPETASNYPSMFMNPGPSPPVPSVSPFGVPAQSRNTDRKGSYEELGGRGAFEHVSTGFRTASSRNIRYG